jgi:hypothetical protein
MHTEAPRTICASFAPSTLGHSIKGSYVYHVSLLSESKSGACYGPVPSGVTFTDYCFQVLAAKTGTYVCPTLDQENPSSYLQTYRSCATSCSHRKGLFIRPATLSLRMHTSFPFSLRTPGMNLSDGGTDMKSTLEISRAFIDAVCTTSSTALSFSLGVSVCQAPNMLRRSPRTVNSRGSSSLELGMGVSRRLGRVKGI